MTFPWFAMRITAPGIWRARIAFSTNLETGASPSSENFRGGSAGAFATSGLTGTNNIRVKRTQVSRFTMAGHPENPRSYRFLDKNETRSPLGHGPSFFRPDEE